MTASLTGYLSFRFLMKYFLIITALITAIIAIKGETWDASQTGIKRVTKTGWLISLFALISASISIQIEYSEQSVKNKQKALNKHTRFHTMEQLAYDFHQIELLAFEFEKSGDISQVLRKVQLHTKFIKDSIELNSSQLTPEELINFEDFIRLSNEEIEERQLGTDFMNNIPMPELARYSREIRFRLCKPMLNKSYYCNYIQTNPTANEFFAHEDPKMLVAMSDAKKTLPKLLNKIPELRSQNIELQVKVAIPVGDGSSEHMWLGNVSYINNKIVGQIRNYPVVALHIRFGQHYTARFEDVSDWMAIKNGVVHGGYMLRVNLGRMSDYELDRFFSSYKYEIPIEILVL